MGGACRDLREGASSWAAQEKVTACMGASVVALGFTGRWRLDLRRLLLLLAVMVVQLWLHMPRGEVLCFMEEKTEVAVG